MSSLYEIPLIAASQQLTVPLNGATYQLNVFWCDPNSSYVMDISDNSGKLLVGGVPLITGVDLLSPFPYLKIAGQLYIVSDKNPAAVPQYADLGVIGHLYFVPSTS
jgi:hypothetical protein